MDSIEKKMKVEIWSDIMCPFCYIGKRKFEKALEQFPEHKNIGIIWKSYQLSPDLKTDLNLSAHQSLANHKGISVEQAQQMNQQVASIAADVGLTFNYDRQVVANSFNAHRFLHFAKEYHKQNEAEELLFRAYFTEGKNIDDFETLIELAEEIDLEPAALRASLENNMYAEDVKSDIREAHDVGVQGVPFFVFNRKYGVSGAQESSSFLEVLKQSFEEWRKENPDMGFDVVPDPDAEEDNTNEL